MTRRGLPQSLHSTPLTRTTLSDLAARVSTRSEKLVVASVAYTRSRAASLPLRQHRAYSGPNARSKPGAVAAVSARSVETRPTITKLFQRQPWAGTTVETTIRVVSRWLKDGLVREEENRLVLASVEALRDLAEGESD